MAQEMINKQQNQVDVAIVGSGPTGLMAAQIAAQAGRKVVIFDRMRQPGRKFLLAGSDGLNLTFAENLDDFAYRYDQPQMLHGLVKDFTPDDLRHWADGLGAQTFVGSSGRVFPKAMKASPLLRAWLAKLHALGVEFRGQHHLSGWAAGQLHFGDTKITARSTLLALGGASWPRFGTDGGWRALLPADAVSTLEPSNCRFPAKWSDLLLDAHEGTAIKNIAVQTSDGWRQGDIMIVKNGLEGGPVYASAKHWQQGGAINIDLVPHRSGQWLDQRWQKMPSKLSTSAKLKRLNLKPAARALVMEARANAKAALPFPGCLKTLEFLPCGAAVFERAISTRGGVKWSQVDQNLKYHHRPNTYIGGEMLDWDAPTGGYLLQACFAMGHRIGHALAQEAKDG